MQVKIWIHWFSRSAHVAMTFRWRFHGHVVFCNGSRWPFEWRHANVPRLAGIVELSCERPDQCNFLMATERREKSTLLSTQVPTLAWHGRGLHRSSGRSERLMRVTTGSQARFSACGYTKSKQCMEPPAEGEKLHRL